MIEHGLNIAVYQAMMYLILKKSEAKPLTKYMGVFLILLNLLKRMARVSLEFATHFNFVLHSENQEQDLHVP